jgi:polyisoprenoid-binding protein YceI
MSIVGDLTIKGITKSITIPANVAMAGDKISVVTPSFKINRTDWDVKYGSGLIGTAADKIIHDEIGLVLSLTGQAK